ncbi:unnamed protein product [Larinioides sclopetarius]|uniref:BTB domain-containing protein n=1 Tax=Larinioides sclopetarius TaxID=280406 RepID=A0AAV1ZU58_9ARAC
MIRGDMREKTSECIEIPDLDEETMRELLSYIYSDRVGVLDWQCATDKQSCGQVQTARPEEEVRGYPEVRSAMICLLQICTTTKNCEMQPKISSRDKERNFFASNTCQSFTEKDYKLAVETMDQLHYINYLDN